MDVMVHVYITLFTKDEPLALTLTVFIQTRPVLMPGLYLIYNINNTVVVIIQFTWLLVFGQHFTTLASFDKLKKKVGRIFVLEQD